MRLLAIAFLIVLTSFTVRAQSTPTAPTATPTVVFVNSDSLLNNYAYFKAVKLKLQTLTQKAQDEITVKGQAFQKKVANYQKTANALTPVQKAATEKKLATEQQTLQELQQNTGKQLQEIESAENTTLYEKIAVFLKGYTREKGYKIVLTYSKSSPSMLYGDDSLDVTKDVVAGLNDEYTKSGGK